MSSRLWWLALCLVLAAVGCRNLVQPGEPPFEPLRVPGVILDPDRRPVASAATWSGGARPTSSASLPPTFAVRGSST